MLYSAKLYSARLYGTIQLLLDLFLRHSGEMAKGRKRQRKRREPRKWWDQTIRDVEQLLSAQSSDLSYRVERDPKGATFRFSPPLARDILLIVSIDDEDFVNLHAEPISASSEAASFRRLTWNSHPFCAPCPPRDVMVANLFHNLDLVLRHKVRLREKRVLLFQRFLLSRRVYFEFHDNDEWKPVDDF